MSTSTSLDNHQEVNDKIIEDLKLELKLAYLKNDELKAYCFNIGIEEEKYKNITKKEDYIKLILAEVNK